MQTELPALFNHAFEAYRRLVSSGYTWAGADRFQPEIFTASAAIAIDKETVLRRFVDSCCEFEEGAVTATSELQSAYQQFCEVHRYSPIKGDRFSRELFSVLPDTVIRVKIGNQQRGFKGIQLKNF